MSETSRIAALRAALDMRSSAMRPWDVILLAKQFERYLISPDGPDVPPAPSPERLEREARQALTRDASREARDG